MEQSAAETIHNPAKEVATPLPPKDTCQLEEHLIQSGLVDLQTINPNIRVNLRYSGTNNFLNQDLYGCLDKAYVQKETGLKLSMAHQILQTKDSSLHLLIWDAVRPRTTQWAMWKALEMPLEEKVRYVSNPRNGSIHNFGCAVDLTLVTDQGLLVDMGTDFDHFGPAANVRGEWQLVTDKVISKQQLENRQLLRSVMKEAGFTAISSEWWHFNSLTRAEAKLKYAIVE